ncbi:MAG: SRPBCC family protein [Paenisporosarcina sp.]|nr:SRPBCC family protein [Paenisporosarcina sp.]
MKWKVERIIDAPIEVVWTLFDEENAQRIMPKVVENRWLEKKPGTIGSTYEQTYQEGKRKESYIVEIVEFEDTDDRKHKRIQFTLAGAFEMNLLFTLEQVNENQTHFTYTGSNTGVNFVGRLMLKLGNRKAGNKVVIDFLDRVEQEAMGDYPLSST